MTFHFELLRSSEDISGDPAFEHLTDSNEREIEAFYLSLDHEARRDRFGAVVSDHSIRSYCQRIDWRSSLLIGFRTQDKLQALSTTVRVDIAQVENATIATNGAEAAILPLLRLSAIAARRYFNADRMVVNFDCKTRLPSQIREIYPVTLTEDWAALDLRAVEDAPYLPQVLSSHSKV